MDEFTFVGIDINRKPPHFTFIAVDVDFQPIAIDTGPIESVIAYLSGLQYARISINAPLHLNAGILRKQTQKKNSPGKYPNTRKIEYDLEQLGVTMYHTPDQVLRNDPITASGILLSEYLPQMNMVEGFTEIPEQNHCYFESPAGASFWSLIDAPLLDEDTLMGCIQRQLILFDLDLPLKNPMEFFEELTRHKIKHGTIPTGMVLPVEELNAWINVYCAIESWRSPERMVRLGCSQEGYVFLPSFPASQPLPGVDMQQPLFTEP
ncbi:MAG: hypothetical protein HPY85_05740 [Anaerolineae bacterium]|nr:hypothetical protein [Anaerolineae bacterium]